jgi:hypothetical protein
MDQNNETLFRHYGYRDGLAGNIYFPPEIAEHRSGLSWTVIKSASVIAWMKSETVEQKPKPIRAVLSRLWVVW